MTDGHEIEADPVSQIGDRRLGALGLADHGDDPGQHRILSHLLGPHLQKAVTYSGWRPPPDRRPPWKPAGFAGEHGFVHTGAALDHQRRPPECARRGLTSRMSPTSISAAPGSFMRFCRLIYHQSGLFRGQGHETGGWRPRCAPWSVPPDTCPGNQGDEHPGRFEIEIHDPGHDLDAQADLDQIPGAVNKGGPGADGDKRIHVGCAAPESWGSRADRNSGPTT
jgi:hypothetical protein